MPDKVLFNGQDIYDFIEVRKQQLKSDYKTLKDEQALDEVFVRQFKSNYMMNIPTLKNDSWEREGYQGRMRVFVPFEGDSLAFTLTPSFMDGTVAMGEIVDQDLVFTISSAFQGYDVVAAVKREIAKVELRLMHLRGSMLYLDQQLESGLRESMMIRRSSVSAKKSEREIEIPLRAPKTLPSTFTALPAEEKKVAAEEPIPRSWDIFMSHAKTDKVYVQSLVDALRANGVTVWFDNDSVAWGESLARGMKKGVLYSRYAIVVLSDAYLSERKWTEHELEGFLAREKLGEGLILPIWHGVTHEDVVRYDAPLSLRKAKISTTDDVAEIVRGVLATLGRSSRDQGTS